MVQFCLHDVLRAEVGGDGIVVLLPLGHKLLLVVRTTQVADNLISRYREGGRGREGRGGK